jgi:hypothetical protein
VACSNGAGSNGWKRLSELAEAEVVKAVAAMMVATAAAVRKKRIVLMALTPSFPISRTMERAGSKLVQKIRKMHLTIDSSKAG